MSIKLSYYLHVNMGSLTFCNLHHRLVNILTVLNLLLLAIDLMFFSKIINIALNDEPGVSNRLICERAEINFINFMYLNIYFPKGKTMNVVECEEVFLFTFCMNGFLVGNF